MFGSFLPSLLVGRTTKAYSALGADIVMESIALKSHRPLPLHSFYLRCPNDFSALLCKDPRPSVIKIRPQDVNGKRGGAGVPSFTFNDLPPYNPPIPR